MSYAGAAGLGTGGGWTWQALLSCFGPQEGELIGVVLDLLVEADAGGVSAGGAVVEQNGTATRG